jgi:5-methylcytosine-specific restriction endonuclease McrA
MAAPTPIADMIAKMYSDGVPLEAIIIAVCVMERETSIRQNVDGTAERRRAWDRKRKASLPADWSAITRAVFERDEYSCTYCGDIPDVLHCDHVVPLSRGGSSHMENLTTACGPCNIDKGSKLLSEWKFYQEYVLGARSAK